MGTRGLGLPVAERPEEIDLSPGRLERIRKNLHAETGPGGLVNREGRGERADLIIK